MAGHYDAFYTGVRVEHCVCLDDFFAHGGCEGIVVVWAVEREDYDAGLCVVVLGLDLRKGEVVVGCREGWGGHGGGEWGIGYE